MEPAVDDEIAGDVPQEGIASLPGRFMAKADVEQLVSEDELRLLEAERPRRIDVDLLELRCHGSDAHAETMCDVRLLDDLKRGGQRAEEGIAVDEPAAGPLHVGELLPPGAHVRFIVGGHSDGRRDGSYANRGQGAGSGLT